MIAQSRFWSVFDNVTAKNYTINEHRYWDRNAERNKMIWLCRDVARVPYRHIGRALGITGQAVSLAFQRMDRRLRKEMVNQAERRTCFYKRLILE